MKIRIDADFSFYDVFPDLSPLVIVDVGAASVEGHKEIYQPLLDSNRARLIAFEADPEGSHALNTKLGDPHRCHPLVIGDGQDGVLHKAAHSMCNSLYEPNMAFLSNFQDLTDVMQPIGTEPVQTHRLDDVVKETAIDFLKMDVQGAELSVLQGAERLVPTALVIQTEVEFVPLYIDQPLFSDVDAHLRNLGFQFLSFSTFGARPYLPIADTGYASSHVAQLLWSNALYIPDILEQNSFSDERLLKLAAIFHDCFGVVDLPLRALQILRQRGDSAPYEAYVSRLGINQ